MSQKQDQMIFMHQMSTSNKQILSRSMLWQAQMLELFIFLSNKNIQVIVVVNKNVLENNHHYLCRTCTNIKDIGHVSRSRTQGIQDVNRPNLLVSRTKDTFHMKYVSIVILSNTFFLLFFFSFSSLQQSFFQFFTKEYLFDQIKVIACNKLNVNVSQA